MNFQSKISDRNIFFSIIVGFYNDNETALNWGGGGGQNIFHRLQIETSKSTVTFLQYINLMLYHILTLFSFCDIPFILRFYISHT